MDDETKKAFRAILGNQAMIMRALSFAQTVDATSRQELKMRALDTEAFKKENFPNEFGN